MNEEFAISLKTVLDNSSVQRVKEQLDEITKQYTKQEKVVIDVTTTAKNKSNPLGALEQSIENVTGYSARLKLLKRDIDELNGAISLLNKVNNNEGLNNSEFQEFMRLQNSGIDVNDITALEAKLEGLTEKYNRIISKQQKLNEETKKQAGTVEEVQQKVKKQPGFIKQTEVATKNLSKTVRQVLFSLIGIRSAYSIIRKSMSAYLAQNEELQNKLNACWYALGSLFAPVLEYIINLFIKIVSYVNVLVKALGFAGINMTKYGKATGKAAKEQKQLAGFDEINNLSNGGGTGASNPFANVDIKPGVVNFLTNLFKWLPTIIAGIGLIAFTISTVIKALQEVLTVADMIKQLGIGVALFGLVLTINALINYLNDPTWFNFGMIISGIGITVLGLGMYFGSTFAIITGGIIAITGLVAAFWPQIKGVLEKVTKGLDNAMEYIHRNITTKGGLFYSAIGAIIELVLGIIRDAINTIKTYLDEVFTGIKQIIDGIIKIFKVDLKGGISDVLQGVAKLVSASANVIQNTVSNLFNRILQFIDNLFGGLGSKVQNSVRNIINSYIISPINRLLSWLNDKLNINFAGLSLMGKVIIPPINLKLGNFNSIPMLDSGTNYVPNDMLAMVHEGEAVVPKEFNSSEYFGNEETNILLRELIDVVYSKEFRAYISQNEIGKTAVKYINNQSRILGGSVV